MFAQSYLNSNNSDLDKLDNEEYNFSIKQLVTEDTDTEQMDQSWIFTNEDKGNSWWNEPPSKKEDTSVMKKDSPNSSAKNDLGIVADLFPDLCWNQNSTPLDSLDFNLTNDMDMEEKNTLDNIFNDLIRLEEERDIKTVLNELEEEKHLALSRRIIPINEQEQAAATPIDQQDASLPETENPFISFNDYSPISSFTTNALSNKKFSTNLPLTQTRYTDYKLCSNATDFTLMLNQNRSILKTQAVDKNDPSLRLKNQKLNTLIMDNEKILENKMQKLGQQLVQLSKDGELHNRYASPGLTENKPMNESMRKKRQLMRQNRREFNRLRLMRKNQNKQENMSQSHLTDHCYYLTRNMINQLKNTTEKYDESSDEENNKMAKLRSTCKINKTNVFNRDLNISGSTFASATSVSASTSFSTLSIPKNTEVNPAPVVRRPRGRPRGSTNAAKRKRMEESAMIEQPANPTNTFTTNISTGDGASNSQNGMRSTLRKGRPKRELTSQEKESKRLMHNLRERQRRREMQEHFVRLREALPPESKNKKMSTAALLKETSLAILHWNNKIVRNKNFYDRAENDYAKLMKQLLELMKEKNI